MGMEVESVGKMLINCGNLKMMNILLNIYQCSKLIKYLVKILTR